MSKQARILQGMYIDNSKSGGSGGSTDYNDQINKPQINGETLVGNKSSSELGLANSNLGNVAIPNPARVGKYLRVASDYRLEYVDINTGGSEWVLADRTEYPDFEQGKIINLTNGENGSSLASYIAPVLYIDNYIENANSFQQLLNLDVFLDEHREQSLIVVLVPRDGFAYKMDGDNWSGDLTLAGLTSSSNNGSGILEEFEKRAITTNILQQPLVYLWNGDDRHSSVNGSDALVPLFNQNLLPFSLSRNMLNIKYSEITTNLAQTSDNQLTFITIPGVNSIPDFIVQATPQRIAFNVYYYVKKD